MNETILEAVRGDDNFWNFDVTGDLDAADSIWFRAARSMPELTDADALIVKTRNAGIVDLDAPNGKFQVQLEPADTNLLTTDEALVFHCKIRKADAVMDTTVSRGVMRLTQ